MKERQETDGWTRNGRPTLARAMEYGIELAAYPYQDKSGYNAEVVMWRDLDTPLKLVKVVREIMNKEWYSCDMERDLIDVTAERFGWEVWDWRL